MAAHRRPPVVHVTWQRHAGRAVEIAEALGGAPVHVYMPALSRKPLVPVRYVLSALATAAALVRARPRAVIVTNPPVFPGLVVAAYCAVTRTRFLLDSHPGSFGVKGNVVSRKLLGVTRWLARRSSGVMVTVDHYVRLVQTWGARGLVVHEAPPSWTIGPPQRGPRPRVLFVCVYSEDEPVHEVVEAARLLPDVDVAITGDLRRRPAGLGERAPANVDFVGFLGQKDYLAEIARADVVVSLTTEPTSIMRSAYEAVYALRPLVVSDWPALNEVFPYGHATANEASALAAAISAALEDAPHVQESALVAQRERWEAQLAALREALGLTRA
ncbi:glycosyltransferase [Cellulomonas bogoriensis]|uniref:D-inositol 3-phosphate glycosyltransferase n=1 Tax=Cellulomonas bogoriensis 69B4 = DSM 16987 TaxID=1386082 RepID=A0A0A0BYE2_9CELL|nr:glycosyltransferase [Cellulomonas bogoriensis]KGM12174.1 hypothetical protein N869_02095 [Cellulomonas bogoriensis 69B4 = DSM 16987]